MEFKPTTNTESENKQLEQTMTTSVMVCKKAGCLQDMTYAEPSILLSLVKGIYNGDTKSEVHSKVAQMNLEETVVIDRRDIQSFSEGHSSSQVNAVIIKGRCWRCNQEGHRWPCTGDLKKMQPGRTLHQRKQKGREEEGRGGHGKFGASHAQHHGRHQHQPVPVQSLGELN